jgi:peptidoglycan-associated lipoprotein
MQKQWLKILLVAGVIAIAGCGTKPIKPAASGSNGSVVTPAGGTQGNGVADAGNTARAVGGDDSANGGASQANGRIVYFDYDSSDVKPEFNDLLAQVARQLVSAPGTKVRLEGNTDERGSPEYNIGLGERRAQAVRRTLMLQGVTEAQISTVSYGEERPADPGQNEAAWAKNRRVEIVTVN